uniref:hypothetical protein n=1 Tax=Halomonas sp. TaxID=1486246 RepID=UPI002612373A|nr:hypothetical protein [Halomonas sp.]
MARNWTKWERSEYDRLEELYQACLSYRQIAKLMGKTFNQVRGMADCLGLRDPNRPNPKTRTDWDEIDAIIVDCVEVEGMCAPQISQRLGALGKQMCSETVLKRLKGMPEVHREARRNAAKKRATASRIYWARQRAKRQQEASA